MTTADAFTLRELVETYAKDIGFYTTLRAYRHSESRPKKEIGVDNRRMISGSRSATTLKERSVTAAGASKKAGQIIHT